jgi:uncharacterized protein (TIGR02246 family)
MTQLRLVAVIALLVLSPPVARADETAARAVTREYRNAWLANDPARVMATLTADAVLLPSGMKPIAGEAAIRRFWFPATGPATRVTAMELTIDGITGQGGVYVLRGTGTLSYELTYPDGRVQKATQASWFVNVVERQPDGRWLITSRAWSDLR